MKDIVCAESIGVAAPLAAVFAIAAGPDVTALFRAHGPVPGVVAVSGHEGAWSAPGETRLLSLSDGAGVREDLVAFRDNESFAYRVSGFTGLFGALVREARGEWRFRETAPGETRIEWTYRFSPASPLAALAGRFVVSALWPGYMRAALARIQCAAEERAVPAA